MADGLKYTIQIEGMKELENALRRLPVVIEKRVERTSLRRAANRVKKMAKALCPVLQKKTYADEVVLSWRLAKGGKLPIAIPGFLRDSIKVLPPKKRRKGFVSLLIGTAEGWFKGQAFYGGIVEFGGTVKVNYKAQPFIRPAFDSQREVLVEDIVSGINNGLTEVWMNRENNQVFPGYSEEGTIS